MKVMKCSYGKSIRYIYLFSSVLFALGVSVILLMSLSSAVAAPEDPSSKINVFNTVSSEHWRILTDMQKNRGDPGVVALNNQVYVVSGYFPNGYGYNYSNEVYNPMTDSWLYFTGLPVSRSDLMLAAITDTLYAFGGWNEDLGGAVGFNNRYDPVTDTWITATSMITPVSGAGIAVISNTIYIIGGYDNNLDGIGLVQKYDPISDNWSLGTPLPVGTSELGAVVLNGQIYAIGGVKSDSSTSAAVEVYDPVSDSWNSGPPMPESRASMAVAVRQGKIYVIGGTDDWAVGTPKDTTFVYDPGTGQWSTVDPMPTARRATRAAVVVDIIYVIGGDGEPGAGSANEGYGFAPITTTTTISSDNPDPSQAFQPFTISYNVTSTTDIPTGVVTVTVRDSSDNCIGTLVNGSGSCDLSLDAPGIYTLTATYGGDYIHVGSSEKEEHSVVKTDTTTMITEASPEPSVVGRPVTVTYTVTSPYVIPTGTVTVTVVEGDETCSSTLESGMGNCVLEFAAAGNYALTATYSGDSIFNPSSDTEIHTVVKSDTTTTITEISPEPSVVGQPVTVTLTVTSPYAVPTGTVTVAVGEGDETCTSTLENGIGICVLEFTTAGNYTLTATYSGNTVLNPSSDTEMHNVEPLKLFIPFVVQ
jgi:N-acetylneuraminic acid mutarotase